MKLINATEGAEGVTIAKLGCVNGIACHETTHGPLANHTHVSCRLSHLFPYPPHA